MNTTTRSLFFWPIFFVSHFLAMSLLAWHLLAQVSFEYPLGYKLIGIDKHIQEFAPRNNFKEGFQYTKPQKHWDIFSQISYAIQHHGKGLSDIEYLLPNGTHVAFMHKAEIIHLQDVANLIDTLYLIGCISGVIWILLLFLAYKQQLSLPRIKNIIIGFMIGTCVITVFVVSFGATKIFYWLHTKIFPDGHQWFFYYEDSLMTTLMKAPDIFAFIAALLVMLLLILWTLSIYAQAKLLPQHIPLAQKSNKSRSKKIATENNEISGIQKGSPRTKKKKSTPQ